MTPSSNPLQKPKEAYAELLKLIGSEQSPVGLDAQYTHAIIIDFLQQILARLERIEEKLT